MPRNPSLRRREPRGSRSGGVWECLTRTTLTARGALAGRESRFASGDARLQLNLRLDLGELVARESEVRFVTLQGQVEKQAGT